MAYFVNCNTASLNPIGGNLDKNKAEHLYRRLGFSASVDTINSAIGEPISAHIDMLINEALNMPEIPEPSWANWTWADYPADDDARNALRAQHTIEFRSQYVKSFITNNLRDRLSFFWSNHLVTEMIKHGCNSFQYHYINCLQRNAVGNFKEFVRQMGLESAMLYYLDGVFNNGNNPNENYARELYELFTLGEGNGYTEEDIIETAKALTGWVNRGDAGCTAVTFDATKYDSSSKTILGQTANFDYDGVIDNLFEQRPNEISWFICKKLYEFFVHPDSTDDANNAEVIIQGLAATFRANDFEIAPVLAQLFKSEHFYDEEAVGVIIKSPFDIYINLLNETGFKSDSEEDLIENIIQTCKLLGQEIYNPPGVEGWYRDRYWINTNFMIGRWLSSEMFLQIFWDFDSEQFRTLALNVTGPSGMTTNDPDEVTDAILNKLLPKGIADDERENAYDVFRSDVPEQYYIGGIDGSWSLYYPGAENQVYQLLLHIIRQPEFQLK
ncbi:MULTISPECIES: DUF1800 domain-containing protein [unclassified Cellulophaga]|uniref:DUF1800 domain-containing protein n=1 Tax=unclassified Cellulophaga TaxID=2634405 RepID=UPI0026E1549F|nr:MULTISPECIES: DUF1800 domain-containing protein [unclassified Cellulophaga]MDO6490122.1 DUF1800 domain-containing protein [Cellulophaga sp. 2_MG-2023]MDO6494684.1 DUF1800 domain-containing protein [Cellulophaga sp. 3_MG-2023]